LIWFLDSNSDIQKKDIKNLLKSGFDEVYLSEWVDKLNLGNKYQVLKDE